MMTMRFTPQTIENTNTNTQRQIITTAMTCFFLLFFVSFSTFVFAELDSSSDISPTSNQKLGQSETETATVDKLDLDVILNEFKASRKNSVEITMFKQLAFDAELIALPEPRRHAYLTRTFNRFAPESNIKSTLGLEVKSKQGKVINLYLIDELAQGIKQHLKPGDKISLEAYHVYNSEVGPGLLVYQWKKQPRVGLLKKWWRAVFSET